MRFRSLFAAFLMSAVIMSLLLRSDNPPEPDIVVPHIAGDLETYVHEQESHFSDIRPGAEKNIVWHNSREKNRTRYSIIYLHGFAASRQETAPLCDLVADKINANLFYARLAGHGRSDNAMAEATVHAWKQDAVEALTIGRLLGDQVIVIGTSEGGTLATWLALQDTSSDIAALVLLSPNFGPKNRMSYLLNWPGAEFLGPIIIGKNRSRRPYNDLQAQYWTMRYPSAALFPKMQLLSQVKKFDFESINVPTLFVYSENDKVVDCSKTDDVYEQFLTSKRDKIQINESGDPSNHILAGDVLSPETTEPLAEELVIYLKSLDIQ